MAIKAAKTNTELDALFTQLAEPFDPNEIKWRVTHTTQDGRRGAVVAYADPRAYTDRLNQLFTPTGWSRTYEVSTISAVTRMKRDKLIQTGKVLMTCTLTITGLGCHAGSGEDWADESNAMTTAEAQAFKRAASCYGLGRYLYNLAEMWVPLNEHRQPFESPHSPQWALPKRGRPLRTIQHPARTLRQSNEGPSIRESRARSKAFGAFSEIQFTARYCGVLRELRKRMPSRTRSCRRMSRRRWNVRREESARCTPW